MWQDTYRGKNEKIVIFILIGVIIGLSFALIHSMLHAGETPQEFWAESEEANGNEGNCEASSCYDSSITVSTSTTVLYHLHYSRCGHDVYIPRQQGTVNLVGLNRAQVEDMYPAYTLEKFDEAEVVLSYFVDDFCRDCNSFVFLGVKDGKVAIFYGKARDNAPLKKLTDIEVSGLPKHQQKELLKGITVDGIDLEINTILEGLDR